MPRPSADRPQFVSVIAEPSDGCVPLTSASMRRTGNTLVTNFEKDRL